MNDRLFHILFLGHGDPNVRQWWTEVLECAKAIGPAEPFDYSALGDAIQHPMDLVGESGAKVRKQLAGIDRLVVSQNEGLRRRAELFSSRFNAFSFAPEPSRGMQKPAEKAVDGADGFRMGFFRDVRVGSLRISSHVDRLQERVRHEILQYYLDTLASELKRIAAGEHSSRTAAVLRLWDIEILVSDLQSLLDMPLELFRGEARKILDEVDAGKENLSPKARLVLLPLRDLILSSLYSSGLEEGELREFVLEARFLLFRSGEPEDATADPSSREAGGFSRATAEEKAAPRTLPPMREEQRSRELSFGDLSTLVHSMLMAGDSEKAVKSVRVFDLDNALASALLLDAGFRYRLGDDSPIYKTVFIPFIRRVLIVDTGSKPPINPSVKRASHSVGMLERLVRFGMPIVLELGGSSAFGLELAAENVDAAVVSVCPVGAGSVNKDWPRNFLSVAMRAAEIVPVAAVHGPFARNAVMASPPSDSWISMLLSALLAVAPGRSVDIYDFPAKDARSGRNRLELLDPLKSAGFAVSESVLEAGDKKIPPSLRRAGDVDLVSISVPEFGLPPCGTEAGNGYRERTGVWPGRKKASPSTRPGDPSASRSDVSELFDLSDGDGDGCVVDEVDEQEGAGLSLETLPADANYLSCMLMSGLRS